MTRREAGGGDEATIAALEADEDSARRPTSCMSGRGRSSLAALRVLPVAFVARARHRQIPDALRVSRLELALTAGERAELEAWAARREEPLVHAVRETVLREARRGGA